MQVYMIGNSHRGLNDWERLVVVVTVIGRMSGELEGGGVVKGSCILSLT